MSRMLATTFFRSPAARALPLAFAAIASPAAAQTADRYIVEPPTAKAERLAPPAAAFGVQAAPVAAAAAPTAGGEASFDLRIQYTEAEIYNPGTDSYDQVRLRSYRDVNETAPPTIPFAAPSIEVAPGETVRLTLRNELPAEPGCEPPDVNTPNCFNRTNLHSHGLWVSPMGNGDNVHLSINPGVTFQYEYNVSLEHPTGTFWYHPHRHGSTALQVSSGMAGVLVVKGGRVPTPARTGDLDTLLRNADGTPYRDRIILLQQIQYACRDASGTIKADGDGKYICNAGDIGGIEGYDQFGPGSWPDSGRYTSINGVVIPTFPDAVVGRIERWRIVHAGVRDTVNLQFKKMRDNPDPYSRIEAEEQQDWVSRNCPGDELLPQFAIAADGLTRRQIVERTTTTLQPGYREDVLVVFPEPGAYCILDDAAPAESSISNEIKPRKYLGRVSVAAGPAIPPPAEHLKTALIAAADSFMPADIRQAVRDDLANGLLLSSFVPHPDVADSEVQPPQQEVRFRVAFPKFQINEQSYDPNRIDRLLPLGGVQEWKITSTNAQGHPFHIHVNPFQIDKIINNATGADVSASGAGDPQYAHLKGVWKDTLFVRVGYTAFVRTRYERYVGDFVLHCHILDHEDLGMMQNIRIAIPDGLGGVMGAHH